MTRSRNSNKYVDPQIKRVDPWDLMNKIIPTDCKQELKKRMLDEGEMDLYDIPSTKYLPPYPKKWKKRNHKGPADTKYFK